MRACGCVCVCVCKGEIEKERELSGGFVGITIFVRERENNYYTRRESVTFSRQQHRRHKRNTASVFCVSLSFFLEKPACHGATEKDRQRRRKN